MNEWECAFNRLIYTMYDSTNIDADERTIKTIGDVEEKETVGVISENKSFYITNPDRNLEEEMKNVRASRKS